MAVKAPIIVFERELEVRSGANFVEIKTGSGAGSYDFFDENVKAVYDGAGKLVWVNHRLEEKPAPIKTRFKGTQVLFSDLVTFTGTRPGPTHHRTKKNVGVLLFDIQVADKKETIGVVFSDVVQVFDSGGELAWERPADYKYP